MKVELKDLLFIDKVAMAIISSKLTNLNMAQDQIESLATSSYLYAKVVHQVRENFKKEHDIEEVYLAGITEKEYEDLTAEDLRDAYYQVTYRGEWVEKEGEKEGEKKVEEAKIEENPEKEIEDHTLAIENETKIVIDKPRRGRPKSIRVESREAQAQAKNEKPKRGRKPKAILKINKILDKK
jgi:hypothetical protein